MLKASGTSLSLYQASDFRVTATPEAGSGTNEGSVWSGLRCGGDADS